VKNFTVSILSISKKWRFWSTITSESWDFAELFVTFLYFLVLSSLKYNFLWLSYLKLYFLWLWYPFQISYLLFLSDFTFVYSLLLIYLFSVILKILLWKFRNNKERSSAHFWPTFEQFISDFKFSGICFHFVNLQKIFPIFSPIFLYFWVFSAYRRVIAFLASSSFLRLWAKKYHFWIPFLLEN